MPRLVTVAMSDKPCHSHAVKIHCGVFAKTEQAALRMQQRLSFKIVSFFYLLKQ